MKRFPLTVWGYALLISLVMLIPYIVGVLSTPDGWQYSGAITVPDGAKVDYYSHMAKMWQGAAFDFDNNLLFTHEQHAGLPTVQLFYYLLGAIATLTTLDFPTIYHLAQFIFTFTMILAIWAFASRYLETNGERWVAMWFATIVLGWSWILFFLAPDLVTQPERTPIELWLFDAYNLLGVLAFPHFPAAVTLLLIGFLTFDSWLHRPQHRYIAILTLVLLADAIIQPYVVLMTFLIFGLMTGYHWLVKKSIRLTDVLWLIFPALAHGGIAVYQYLLISGDPVWATFTAQNQTHSPPPIYYVLGYLPLLIPIALGWRHIIAAVKRDDRWLLPISWVIVVIFLLYLPFPTQRRYLLGVQTPLAVIAALGWYRVVLVRIVESWRPFANIPYIAAGSLALLMMLFANTMGVSRPDSAPGVYYSADELAASDWIRNHTAVDDLILTTFDWDTSGSGGQVVAMTGRRVYAGHWIETKDFDAKRLQLMTFYDPTTDDEWRQTFLESIEADLIWYDDDVENFGDWQPQAGDFLTQVFDSETVQLFDVNRDEE